MSDSFDPYYIWLGIPPKDQPPNHYRLLGIQELEENTDVIDAAANRQTTYLHEMTAGPNRKESQQLLNEIAAVRRCLLSPEQKSAYDATLRAEQAASQAAVVPVAQVVVQPVTQPVAQPISPAVPFLDPAESPGSEIPNFDFSAGGPPDVGVDGSPGFVVNTDVGFSGVEVGSNNATTTPTQPAKAGAPNRSDEAAATTGKKPIPRQWIITGCTAVVVAIIAFVLTSGSDSDGKKRPTSTSTRLDGSGEAVTSSMSAGSDDSSPNESKDGGAKNDDDDGRSLFDQADTSDSPFKLQSSFGSKEKKKTSEE